MCGQKQKMHENKSTQAVQKALCVHDCAHIISLEPQRLPLARVCEKSPKSGAENPVILAPLNTPEKWLESRMIRYRCNYN